MFAWAKSKPSTVCLRCLARSEQELRAAADDRLAVPQEFVEQFLEVQHARLAIDQRQEDQRERVLQRRELVELREHDFGIGVALQIQHQADRLFQIAFVAAAGNAGDFAVVDHLVDFLLDAVARLLEGDFADDDAEFVAVLFDGRPGADDDRAAAGVIAAADARAAADDAAGGKIGAGHDFHQFVDRDFRLVDHADQRVADFAQIVRRNRRRHAHRDAVRPVHQQIREPRRQHDRLHPPFVVGGNEIDRVELQIVEHRRRDGRHAGFGVSHGRRRQARDRAEVSLLVDQRVPHVPFLGHADQRGIDHAFAVRMIVAARIAGDFRALDAGRAGSEVQVVHGDENSPLRRLQPVAHVGQRTADDDAHGVGQITPLEFILDAHFHNLAHAHRHRAGGQIRGGSIFRGRRLLSGEDGSGSFESVDKASPFDKREQFHIPLSLRW